MLTNLFKKITINDLINELKSKSFNESKVDSIIKNLNINHINQNLQNLLHIIVPLNKIESVRWLIKNGINFDAKDANGITPLMLACKHGFIDSIDELLKKTKTHNDEDYKGHTAIEYAVYNNNFKAYKRLKPFIKDINRKNKIGQTLLHLAINVHNQKVIDDLYSDDNFDFSDEILFYKSTYEKKEILNTILAKFDNYKKIDKYGRNILFYVVTNGIKSEDIFYYLIERGLKLNHTDKHGNNILFHLIFSIINKKTEHRKKLIKEDESKKDIKNLLDFIPVLIEKGVYTTISNKDHETILTIVTKNRCIDVLEILFEYNVDINMKSDNNETALNSVIIKGIPYLEIIHVLLDYGASPNIKDTENKTTIEKLIDAILITKNLKKVKVSAKKDLNTNTDYMTLLGRVLINTDTNLTMLNSNGEPYFFEALRYGSVELVKLLIKYGSDINQTDSNGLNIIYKYMEDNQRLKKEIELREYHNNLQTIIMMGANVNAKDSFGGITLHKAILNCDMTIIKMILHGGADINAIDNRGRHILHNAIWKNDIKIFKLIYTYNKTLLNEPDKFGVLPINYAAFLGYTNLVLDIIELNSHINNPHPKTKYILNFLKKFHKNLKPLIDNARTKSQKDKLKILTDNMRKEFQVVD